MEPHPELFSDGSETSAAVPPLREEKPKGAARVQRPNRRQLELRPSDLESLLPEGHWARMVWGYVERQDMSGLYAGIKAVEGGVGRAAIAPEILFALWLYATLEGIGSARSITRLTREHDAYRWICGGVQVNYHSVADFRSQQGDALDDLLTDNLASLMAAGVVKLKTAAQDGVRVRASAGAASFRREEKLESLLEAARERVAALKQQVNDDPGGEARAKAARQARAALAREARIEAALARLPELADIKKRQGKKPEDARASTTDAEATVMKMGDGGFRPAYNIEFGSDTESQVIVGVDVVTTGSDMGQMAPMVKQVVARCGQAPDDWLVDGGFPAHDQIDAVAAQTRVIAPVPKPKAKKEAKGDAAVNPAQDEVQAMPEPTVDPHRRKPGGGGLAGADGHRGGQGTLQGARGHGRMRQCPGQESGSGAIAGAGIEESEGGGAAVCLGAQPDAHDQPCAGNGRHRDRYVRNS